MKARAAAVGIAAVLASALFAQPASAGDTLSGSVVFDGTLGQEVEVLLPGRSPVSLIGHEFSGDMLVTIGDLLFPPEPGSYLIGELAPPSEPAEPSGPILQTLVVLLTFASPPDVPLTAELAFTCLADASADGSFRGGCLIEGYGAVSQGTVQGTGGTEERDPLEFVLNFDLKCGQADYPCLEVKPSDTESA